MARDASAMTQKAKILQLLKDASTKGVNSYGVARDIALQLPTRIYELKQQGYIIKSRQNDDKSVTYFLFHEPSTPHPEAPTMPVDAPKAPEPDMFTRHDDRATLERKLREVEEKLAALRVAYRHSHPSMQPIIKRQGMMLNLAKEGYEKKLSL